MTRATLPALFGATLDQQRADWPLTKAAAIVARRPDLARSALDMIRRINREQQAKTETIKRAKP